MAHFGIVTPPVPGHIHPFAALGRALLARGHRVTCFQVRDLETKIRSEGLEFHAVGQKEYPRGSLPASLEQLGRRKGLAALTFTIGAVERTSIMVCRDLPDAAHATGITALLIDQMEPAGGAVAEHLGLPFITVCNALPINRDPVAPPPFSPWRYRRSLPARLRNGIGYAVSDWLTSPVTRAVAKYRRQWNLEPLQSPDDSFSRLAQICQMPSALDFPRTTLPASFHYVGPLRDGGPSEIPFPWEQLDGRPLVYASLGTLQNTREPVFRCFAAACQGLDVQLVISHGGGLTSDQARSLPGNPVVVPYAPQLRLLERAKLTLTHAGLNTVLDSLASGVPLIAIPITYEQPAIARRVERTGSGQSLQLRGLTPRRLRHAIAETLEDGRYRIAAAALQAEIIRAGGVRRAADIVEAALAASVGGGNSRALSTRYFRQADG